MGFPPISIIHFSTLLTSEFNRIFQRNKTVLEERVVGAGQTSVKAPTTMRSPTPNATANAHATTYTTIPISGSDVISRSFQNVSSFVSLRRPWPEVIASSGSFDKPDSLADAANRLRLNSKYFFVNYAILVSICACLSFIGVPGTLIVFASVFTLWLVLYFFREDPMVLWGHPVNDRMVLICLVVVTALAAWLTGFVNNLLIGISIGLLIAAVHGIFRNPEGLFLDENDAASTGLIGSPSSSRNSRPNFSI